MSGKQMSFVRLTYSMFMSLFSDGFGVRFSISYRRKYALNPPIRFYRIDGLSEHDGGGPSFWRHAGPGRVRPVIFPPQTIWFVRRLIFFSNGNKIRVIELLLPYVIVAHGEGRCFNFILSFLPTHTHTQTDKMSCLEITIVEQTITVIILLYKGTSNTYRRRVMVIGGFTIAASVVLCYSIAV